MAQSEDAEKIGKRSGAVQHEIYMVRFLPARHRAVPS